MTSALFIIGCLLLAAPDDQVIVKQKQGIVIVKDKSKPIRRELEAVFAERVRATRAADGEALVALAHPDYSFVMPDGQEVGYDWLTAYLRRGTEQFIEIRELTITAETIYPRREQGPDGQELLVAVVEARQRVGRTQRLADGQVHEVFSTVLQDETWVRVAPATATTPARWQLRNTANLREQTVTVDGQKVDPFAR
jgi:hypothetical protein